LRRIETSPNRRRGWVWISLGLLAVGLCLSWLALPVGEWTGMLQRRMLDLGICGVLIFAAVFVAATLVLAPDWPLAIAAGMVYGFGAVPLVLVAAIAAASLAFLAARYLGRHRVRALLATNRKFAAVDNAVTEQGWKIVALLRLSPLVPFNVQNYLFGITEIPFLHYFAASCAGTIPGTVLFVSIGAFGNVSGGPLEWAFLGVGLAATAIVPLLVTRKATQKLAEAGVNDRAP
jgi:uncharacterized membrane protein YdjX (TVP38/TMEM64 family)